MGPVSAIPSLLAEYGLDPTLVLAEVGLAPGIFDYPENRVSYEALAGLLATCVERTRCRHFGLPSVSDSRWSRWASWAA